jgi:glycosyltransferase involved in cell wall biosynthesis
MTAFPDRNASASPAATAPLVSVIVRSTGRPELRQALDSIAAQTYPRIEVILVNAKGADHPPQAERCGDFPLRMIGGETPLARSRAANLGLDQARGDYLIYLDDDDWFLPEHIAGLVEALVGQEQARAAYAGVECLSQGEDGKWERVRTFNADFDRARLWCENYIPIHAMLFARNLVAEGCRFDEQLDCYEDWDFWIQSSLRTPFLHVDRLSAVYRISRGSGFGARDGGAAGRRSTVQVFEKWRRRWSESQYAELLNYAKARVHLERERADLLAQLQNGSTRERQLARRQRSLAREYQTLLAELEASAAALRRVRVQQLSRRERLGVRWSRWRAALRRQARAAARRAQPVAAPLARFAGIVRTVVRIGWREGPMGIARGVVRRLRRRFMPATGVAAPPEGRAPDFPAFDRIEMSVVIVPSGEPPASLIACLESIRNQAEPSLPYEVIVSGFLPAPLETALAGAANVRRLPAPAQTPPCESFEAALGAARGEWIAVMSGAVRALGPWMGVLVETFRRDRSAALLMPKLLNADGRLASAGLAIGADGTLRSVGGEEPDGPCHGFLRAMDCPAPECFALRRELLELLGGVDRAYRSWSHQVADLALRLRALGQGVWLQPLARFSVHGRAPAATAPGGEAADRERLRRRLDSAARFRERLAPDPVARAGGRERMLVVDVIVPTPDKDSGSLRIFRLLELLAQMPFQITFIPANLQYLQGYVEALQGRGIEVLYAPCIESVERVLEERGTEFDVVLLSRIEVAAVLIGAVKRHAPQAFTVFDTVDLHFLREERQARLSGQRADWERARARREQELAVAARSDVTLVVSDAEKELLGQVAPGLRVERVSNVHELHAPVATFRERAGMMFLGGYCHPPNVDAARYFVTEIWPRVRARLGAVTVYLVGSNPPPEVEALAGENVVVTGYVPDLAPYFERCRLSLAPLRFGAGVKGKINSSMSHGLPVVATPIAVEGMHLRDGEDVLVADGADAFADAVVRLYRDEALWSRLSENGLDNVAEHFSVEAARNALRRVFVLGRTPG